MSASSGPDPRVERSRRLVREAALAELAERGYGGFSIESVSRRCGVAKSTIYRHWPGRLALVAEAFESLDVQPDGGGTPPGAPVRVEELLRHLAEAMRDSRFGGCLPALIEASEHDPDVARFLRGFSARRRQALVDAIEHGVAAGDLRPGLPAEETALALSGAIIYCRLMTDRPFDPEDVPRLMASLLPD